MIDFDSLRFAYENCPHPCHYIHAVLSLYQPNLSSATIILYVAYIPLSFQIYFRETNLLDAMKREGGTIFTDLPRLKHRRWRQGLFMMGHGDLVHTSDILVCLFLVLRVFRRQGKVHLRLCRYTTMFRFVVYLYHFCHSSKPRRCSTPSIRHLAWLLYMTVNKDRLRDPTSYSSKSTRLKQRDPTQTTALGL